MRQERADGVELRFAVNDPAGFTLTHLLCPQLATAPSDPGRERVVGGTGADRLRDVMLERSYRGIQPTARARSSRS